MTPLKIEEIKSLLIKAGYEKELNEILFIEDINLNDIDSNIDFDITPIEFEELY